VGFFCGRAPDRSTCEPPNGEGSVAELPGFPFYSEDIQFGLIVSEVSMEHFKGSTGTADSHANVAGAVCHGEAEYWKARMAGASPLAIKKETKR